jgi:molybdenum cofactor cytidylyltransferase
MNPEELPVAETTVPRLPRIIALVLAAGASVRMGANKLLADWRGKPIVRRTVEAALASHADPVVVVTGFDADCVRQALTGLNVQFAHNPNYSEGLSMSLSTGLKAVGECDGVLVLLGDMPQIAPSLIDRMIAAFSPDDGRAICVATRRGKRGNPVLWARRFFSDMQRITGDKGARHLIGANEGVVYEVEADDDSVLADVDTIEELAALRARKPT